MVSHLVDISSSLMYIPVEFNLSMSWISFIFTLKVASSFNPYFSTNSWNDNYFIQ